MAAVTLNCCEENHQGKSRMDNPETLVPLSMKDKDEDKKTKNNNKHKI
jgi:hypothetical protein